MSAIEPGIDEIRAREEALHRRDVRHSSDALEELIAEGFHKLGSSGRVYSRDVMIELLLQEEDSAEDGELQSADMTPIFDWNFLRGKRNGPQRTTLRPDRYAARLP